MIKITAALVRELRERTGAGMMDCKKILLEVDGNIALAIEKMRRAGTIKAVRKAENITADGVVVVKTNPNYGVILEVNCQTDFVAKDSSFQEFSNKVLNTAFSRRITNIEILKAQCEEERIALIAKTGENINIRRMECITSLEEEVLGAYQHRSRIGVLISAKGVDEVLVKQLAMHIAASNPKFIKPEDIPIDIIEKEYQDQLGIAMQYSKSKKVIKKIVEGRMNKFIEELSLISQPFVIDTSKSVSNLLRENNANVSKFIRFELGEGIEKAETNLVKEVSLISKKS